MLGLIGPLLYQAEAAVLNPGSVKLAWDAVPETNIQSYRVHVGIQSQQYTQVYQTSPIPVFQVMNLEFGRIYYLAVSAVNIDGLESRLSEELAVTVTAPQAVADSYSTSRDVPLVVPAAGLLANDALTGSPPFIAVLNSEPQHGTLSLDADGGFTYVPAAGYSGTDAFTYQAISGGLVSNIGTVALTVHDSVVQPPGHGTPTLSGPPGARLVSMAAVPAGTYVLERSENLTDWEYVIEAQLTSPGPLELHDTSNPVVPALRTFYRIGSTAFSPGN